MSLLQRLGLAAPEENTYDLFPQLQQQDETSIAAPLPASGESIDDPPTPPNDHPQVITAEVG
jgi:hypothetical protein